MSPPKKVSYQSMNPGQGGPLASCLKTDTMSIASDQVSIMSRDLDAVSNSTSMTSINTVVSSGHQDNHHSKNGKNNHHHSTGGEHNSNSNSERKGSQVGIEPRRVKIREGSSSPKDRSQLDQDEADTIHLLEEITLKKDPHATSHHHKDKKLHFHLPSSSKHDKSPSQTKKSHKHDKRSSSDKRHQREEERYYENYGPSSAAGASVMVPQYADPDIIRSGHIEYQTLYASNAVHTGPLTVNVLNAPNDSTMQCGCENINCPFCNLMLSIDRTDPNVLQ